MDLRPNKPSGPTVITAVGTIITLFGAAGFVVGLRWGALAWLGLMSAVLAFGLMLVYLGRARRQRPGAS